MLWFSYLYPHFRVNVSFKGPWHEIFYLCYFHQTIPPRPLIQGKSLLVSWSKLTKFVAQRCQWYHCVCMSPRCQWHCWAYHSSVNDAVHPTLSNIFANYTVLMGKYDSAGHCTALSMTPLWLAERYQWHCCDLHSGINANMTPLWLWTSYLSGSGYL
jgi:hypothetical protein